MIKKFINEKREKYFSLVEKIEAQNGYFSESRGNRARVNTVKSYKIVYPSRIDFSLYDESKISGKLPLPF